MVARERDTRNQIQQLEQDARSNATVIASLNAECERLEGLTAPRLEVLPLSPTAAAPTSVLERASLTTFLWVRLQQPALSQADALAPLAYDHSLAEWRAAYPTPDSQKKQLARATLGWSPRKSTSSPRSIQPIPPSVRPRSWR
ncbi:hypothetical protein ACFFLM_06130 [Deinococcus oregonensis]|uniref:Uncharacterized protein n=1 Tax=Deinococcus oregonensis TaxID=1805970 RepID=A0ABV6AVL4_9DEIO